jgi:hypothetical protein
MASDRLTNAGLPARVRRSAHSVGKEVRPKVWASRLARTECRTRGSQGVSGRRRCDKWRGEWDARPGWPQCWALVVMTSCRSVATIAAGSKWATPLWSTHVTKSPGSLWQAPSGD